MKVIKRKIFKQIADMVINNNGHALSLFKKAYDSDNKVLNYLPSNHKLKKIKYSLDLYKSFTPEQNGDVLFWNCLDPNHLCFYYQNKEIADLQKKLSCFSNNELEYLLDNYRKSPHLIKAIAVKLATAYPDQPFWAYLAVENGANEGCVLISDFYVRHIGWSEHKIPQKMISFLEYYASRLHKESSFEREKIMNVFRILGDIFGQLLERKKGNKIKARVYYKSAAELGDRTAQFNYSQMLIDGEGGEKDLPRAREYCKMAADQGVKEAQIIYATMLVEGIGGEKNLPKSREYFKKAADQGDGAAQDFYAIMLSEGEGGEKDLKGAREYFKKAAELGNREAQYNYARMLSEGQGGEKNFLEARKYYKKAVEHGYPGALNNYALMLWKGEGGERDLKGARKYFKQAAAQGDKEAPNNYAIMLQRGEGGEKNFAEASEYYKRVADQGNKNAQFNYALMLYHGEGSGANLYEARKYFKMAAELGDNEAQYCYALMLYYGEGGEKNLAEASEYCKRAADQGDKNAQFKYALMLFEGGGREKGLPEVCKYLKKAAAQGHSDAIMILNSSEINEATGGQEDLEGDIEISLSPLEETTDLDLSSNALGTEAEMTIVQTKDAARSDGIKINYAEGKEIPLYVEKTANKNKIDEIELHQELLECAEKNKKDFAEFRLKKQSGKQEAAARTRQTLIVRKKDYIETCKNFHLKVEMVGPKKKADVESETLEFIKAIFGQGKINTFSNTAAKRAFADLGCTVENKKGENSTSLSFSTTSLCYELEKNRRMALDYQEINDQAEQKTKYHNPHGHGDNNLYNALKPHLKRFLLSINKTPETLQVK